MSTGLSARPTVLPPTISLAIATYRRGAALLRALPSVLEQSQDLQQVLIIDQTEKYPPALERRLMTMASHPSVTWYRGGPPSLPAARNFALAVASGDAVLFVDDDVELLPGCVRAHLDALRDDTFVAWSGRVLGGDTTSSRPPQLRLGGWMRGGFDSILSGPTNTLQGCHMLIRREAAIAVGGFHTGLVGNAFREEADLAMRLMRSGGLIAYQPEPVVQHHHDATGGCRSHIAITEDPLLYYNETRFFRRNYRLSLLPVWLLLLGRRNVICGPAFRERSVARRARAARRGIVRGLFRPFEPAPAFVPRGVWSSAESV